MDKHDSDKDAQAAPPAQPVEDDRANNDSGIVPSTPSCSRSPLATESVTLRWSWRMRRSARRYFGSEEKQ